MQCSGILSLEKESGEIQSQKLKQLSKYEKSGNSLRENSEKESDNLE